MARIDQTPGIRPRVTMGRRMDIAARQGFPVSITILLMLLTKARFNLTGQAELLAAVTFGSAWFWSVYRPASMPPAAAFILGVLLDLLGSLPLGAGVLATLAVHGIAARLRRSEGQQGLVRTWLGFTAAGTAACGLIWLAATLLTFRLLPIGPMIFQAVLNGALYPLLAVPLLYAHRSVADPERA
jgi:rod shape-determining protein MreD